MAGAQGKIPKTCPEVAVFAGDVPYISEMFPYEKQNLPYVTQIDRLAWGITRSDFTRVHAAAYLRYVWQIGRAHV